MDLHATNPLVAHDFAADPFPVGMRVLAVDGDQACLGALESLLYNCCYNVTTCTHSNTALEILRRNRDNFDLVISAVNMPDMDGFHLLKQVGIEQMDIPVLMLSEHSDKELLVSCLMHGACAFLSKPVRMEEMMTIWQYVVCKKMTVSSDDQNQAANKEETEGCSHHGGIQSEKRTLGRKRKAEENVEDDEHEKKARFSWTDELHSKFVTAVMQLGLNQALPRKILKLMDVEGLSKQQVASHLQKFKLGLKKSAKQNARVVERQSQDSFGIFENTPSTPLPSHWTNHDMCLDQDTIYFQY